MACSQVSVPMYMYRQSVALQEELAVEKEIDQAPPPINRAEGIEGSKRLPAYTLYAGSNEVTLSCPEVAPWTLCTTVTCTFTNLLPT